MNNPFNLSQFEPAFAIDPPQQTPAYWFIFQQNRLLLVQNGEEVSLPLAPEPPLAPARIGYQRLIGRHAGIACMAIEVAGEDDTSLYPIGLREAHAHLGEEFWVIAGRASQVLQWNRHHAFCGRCGHLLQEETKELVKRCPSCTLTVYPRLSPAVIMSVVRGNEILLGRAPRFPSGMYSVLAGFVEPGETLEDAVRREVYEEAHIEIGDIRYVASQPWPFPHSLMIGFSARYLGGSLVMNQGELADLGWFRPDRMPALPPRLSVARLLIDRFLAEHGNHS